MPARRGPAVTGMRGVLKANQVTYALVLNAAAGLQQTRKSMSEYSATCTECPGRPPGGCSPSVTQTVWG